MLQRDVRPAQNGRLVLTVLPGTAGMHGWARLRSWTRCTTLAIRSALRNWIRAFAPLRAPTGSCDAQHQRYFGMGAVPGPTVRRCRITDRLGHDASGARTDPRDGPRHRARCIGFEAHFASRWWYDAAGSQQAEALGPDLPAGPQREAIAAEHAEHDDSR